MSGLNKSMIIGNCGQDPEIRYMPNGNAVANLTVATSEKWKDKNTGEQKDETEWHRVVIFGKLAEICGEYVRKGSKIYIEGKMKTRKWTDQQGQEKYTTEIIVDGFTGQMQMLDSKGGNQSQGAQNKQGYAPQQNTPQQAHNQQYQQQQQAQAPQQYQQAPQQNQAPQGGYAPQQQSGNNQQGGFRPK